MAWTYEQATGVIRGRNGQSAHGYSGNGPGKNNPLMEAMRAVGPIPKGRYAIGKPFDHEKLGPFCMRLTPIGNTYTYSRDGFMIHGDSKEHPGEASHGCIVLPRPDRVAIFVSGDLTLEVI